MRRRYAGTRDLQPCQFRIPTTLIRTLRFSDSFEVAPQRVQIPSQRQRPVAMSDDGSTLVADLVCLLGWVTRAILSVRRCGCPRVWASWRRPSSP